MPRSLTDADRADELTGAKTLIHAKTVSAGAAGAVAKSNQGKLLAVAEADHSFETGNAALYDDWNTGGSAARFWSARLSTERADGDDIATTREESARDTEGHFFWRARCQTFLEGRANALCWLNC